jgi:AraC-like DNA-binding protein
MFLDNIIPSNDLSEYIRKYTIVDVVFSPEQNLPFKAYPPHPQDCLQFYPRDTETVTFDSNRYSGKRVVITGQFTAVSNRYIGRNFMTLQVVFQPGALHRLTGLPLNQLNNTYLDADLLLNKEVNLVNEQLFYAKTYPEMIRVVEHYLRQLVRTSKKEAHPLDCIGSKMLVNDEPNLLDWFASEACLCPRQFHRKFKERIGVSPKLFARIVRFNTAYRMKNKYPNMDWLTIAVHCGYYDYQHLVKDYKDLTGLTPVQFTEIENKSPERYFGDAEV